MDKATYCTQLSKHLTDFLGTPVTFSEVLDELFLLEHGCEAKNLVIRTWIKGTATDKTGQ